MKKLLLLCLCAFLLPVLGACGGPRYKLDYCGQKACYTGAKDSYRAGQRVVLYYEIIATDTDYSFYLDGKSLRMTYSERRGYRIEFTMPDHDAVLECRMVNSMVYTPESGGVELPDDSALRIDYLRVDVSPADTSSSRLRAYDYADGVAFLLVEDPGAPPRHYIVPSTLIDECDALTREYAMDTWMSDGERTDYDSAPTYTYRSLEFIDGDRRFTADVSRMPDNGAEALDRLEALLRSYAVEDFLAEE